MRFLIDTQLPRALVDWIRAKDCQAEHVLEIGLAQSKDNSIWTYSLQQNLIIISKDEDFAEWIRQGRAGPRVVWLRIGNASNPALREWLEPRWNNIVSRLENSDRLVEVR
jgi:predicted nuclease of predicted toxin-antitoxin system